VHAILSPIGQQTRAHSDTRSALQVTKAISADEALDNPVKRPRLGNNEGYYDSGDFSQCSQLVFDKRFDFKKDAKAAAAFLKNNIGLAGLMKQEAPAGSVSQRRQGSLGHNHGTCRSCHIAIASVVIPYACLTG